jgi:hypothetical protein
VVVQLTAEVLDVAASQTGSLVDPVVERPTLLGFALEYNPDSTSICRLH